MSRYLITTANEIAWKKDAPVIFLGEWCRRYNRKHIWESMDAIVAQPYGVSNEEKRRDLVECQAIEDALLPVLCKILNDYHGIKGSGRYWRIILGHWLRRHIDTILNRVKTLERCFLNHELLGALAISQYNYSLAPINSIQAIWAYDDDRWNDMLYQRIISLLDVPKDFIHLSIGDEIAGFRLPEIDDKESLRKKGVNCFRYLAYKLMQLFMRNGDAIIVNSYLPLKEAIGLHLSLGQLPLSIKFPDYELKQKVNRELRSLLAAKMAKEESNKLYNIICNLVFELIPISYLEGFERLREATLSQAWPTSPKFIYTCNSFDTNELFKVWAASKVEMGFPYYVGQHGSDYGTHRFWCPTNEEITADKFITWGWTDCLPQHIPSFIFKTGGSKYGSWSRNGGLLLVERSEFHRMTTWDGTYEFKFYFEEQLAFVGNLKTGPRERLKIKLHGDSSRLGHSELLRWSNFDSGIALETGGKSILELIAKSRLVIYSYDSTGMLETLSKNIPTMAFWQNGLDHVRDSAVPYYKRLIKAGIIHLAPESIADKVNAIWDDVEGWWFQPDVQEARKAFCARYAMTSDSPVKDLCDILRSAKVVN